MGYTIEITCKECNFRKIYNLGRAKDKQLLLNVLKTHERSVQDAVRQMHQAYKVVDYEYGKQLMECKGCHSISEADLLIVEFETADDYIIAKYCENCNNQLKILNLENIEHCRCPQCLKFGMKYRHICDWK